MMACLAALVAAVALAAADPFADFAPSTMWQGEEPSTQESGQAASPLEENMPQPAPLSQELILSVDGTVLEILWQENDSVDALHDLAAQQPFTVETRNFGGFEQVGELPQAIKSDDRSFLAQPGDIVLYQGRSIVFFYGSNTWDYTPLGQIEGLTTQQLELLLSGDGLSFSFSLSPQ